MRVPFDKRPTITRFEVSPPDLREAQFHQTFRKNNDYGIVATPSVSEIEQGDKKAYCWGR